MSRRDARELALKLLFEIDLARRNPADSLAYARESDQLGLGMPEAALEFARQLVEGTLAHQREIDAKIRDLAREWTLARMASVDRNVLRLGMYEILFSDDTPISVAINEAVELAKKYGGPDSGKFVNGLLGNLARETGPADPAEKKQF